jgi:hypothetical protein
MAATMNLKRMIDPSPVYVSHVVCAYVRAYVECSKIATKESCAGHISDRLLQICIEAVKKGFCREKYTRLELEANTHGLDCTWAHCGHSLCDTALPYAYIKMNGHA